MKDEKSKFIESMETTKTIFNKNSKDDKLIENAKLINAA